MDDLMEDWIKNSISSGYSMHEIRHRLIEKGYTEAEADSIIKEYQHRKQHMPIAIAAVILLAVSGGFIGIWMMGQDSGVSIDMSSRPETEMSIGIDGSRLLPRCGNCRSGFMKIIDDHGAEVFYECDNTVDCREGYHCHLDICTENTILKEIEEDCTQCDIPCEGCISGRRVCYPGKEDFSPDMKDRCVECHTISQCIEGYNCRDYRCVIS